MRVLNLADYPDRLPDLLEFLERREAENGILCAGVVSLLDSDADPVAALREVPILAVVEDDGTFVAAARWTPTYPVIVTGGPEPAVELLAEALAERSAGLLGVTAPGESSVQFARAWQRLTGRSFRHAFGMRIYQANKLVALPDVGGSFHQAAPEDMELLVQWSESFTAGTGMTPRPARGPVEAEIAEGRKFLWRDSAGTPVSTAVQVGATRHGSRISGVYTPPAFRRKGYGSACTAALTARLLEGGCRFTFLYADLANPTSNSIYQRMGYEPVVDVQEFRFDD